MHYVSVNGDKIAEKCDNGIQVLKPPGVHDQQGLKSASTHSKLRALRPAHRHCSKLSHPQGQELALDTSIGLQRSVHMAVGPCPAKKQRTHEAPRVGDRYEDRLARSPCQLNSVHTMRLSQFPISFALNAYFFLSFPYEWSVLICLNSHSWCVIGCLAIKLAPNGAHEDALHPLCGGFFQIRCTLGRNKHKVQKSTRIWSTGH